MGGVFQPIISLIIGVITAAVSVYIYSKTSKQKKFELAHARDTQISVKFSEKMAGSLELWWSAILKFESEEKLSDADIERLIECSLWLPKEARNRCINLVVQVKSGGDNINVETVSARQEIVRIVENVSIFSGGEFR